MVEILLILSLIFELLALALSLYFSNARIFFLTLALLGAKIPYLFTSVLQAHLFVSLFLPFVFLIFFLKKFPAKIFDRANLSAILLLAFMGILALILPQNTHFVSAALNFEIFNFFETINELGFIIFLSSGLFLGLKALRNLEFYPIVALVGMYVNFLFEKTWEIKYYEFASAVFCFYLLQNAYKALFYDALTKLPNQKKLEFFLKNKESYTLALLHFCELQSTKESYKKLILKQIAKILKRFRCQIFILNDDFILVFKDKNAALHHLAYLESTLKNTHLSLEGEEFKPDFKIAWQENEGGLMQNLTSLKKQIF